VAIPNYFGPSYERFKEYCQERGFSRKLEGQWAFQHPRTKLVLELVTFNPLRTKLIDPTLKRRDLPCRRRCPKKR